MSSYMIRGLPAGLIQRAKASARQDGERLDDILIAFLVAYAARATPAQMGKVGGRARADSLSAERRQEIAREAAIARWQRKPGGSHG